jgi:hypothetical protein
MTGEMGATSANLFNRYASGQLGGGLSHTWVQSNVRTRLRWHASLETAGRLRLPVVVEALWSVVWRNVG